MQIIRVKSNIINVMLVALFTYTGLMFDLVGF